jgi:hypothetical protein
VIETYRAVFGQRGFTHALLAQTPGCDAFAALGTIEADLPSESPAGVVWEPFVRGWASGAHYLFALTVLDPAATRPGMVRTHLLAVPLESLTELCDLGAVWPCLEESWNGEVDLPKAVIKLCDSQFRITSRPPTPETLAVAKKLVDRTADECPVVLLGQKHFRELVTELWQRMPGEFRRDLVFGFTFTPSDLKHRQMDLACCPDALGERWRDYPIPRPQH